MPSGSSSLTISKISSWVGTKLHTVAVFTVVPASRLLPSYWRPSWRLCILHSFFVANLGLRSWTLHQINRQIFQLIGYLLEQLQMWIFWYVWEHRLLLRWLLINTKLMVSSSIARFKHHLTILCLSHLSCFVKAVGKFGSHLRLQNRGQTCQKPFLLQKVRRLLSCG